MIWINLINNSNILFLSNESEKNIFLFFLIKKIKQGHIRSS